jgi:hypothetical protein
VVMRWPRWPLTTSSQMMVRVTRTNLINISRAFEPNLSG